MRTNGYLEVAGAVISAVVGLLSITWGWHPVITVALFVLASVLVCKGFLDAIGGGD